MVTCDCASKRRPVTSRQVAFPQVTNRVTGRGAAPAAFAATASIVAATSVVARKPESFLTARIKSTIFREDHARNVHRTPLPLVLARPTELPWTALRRLSRWHRKNPKGPSTGDLLLSSSEALTLTVARLRSDCGQHRHQGRGKFQMEDIDPGYALCSARIRRNTSSMNNCVAVSRDGSDRASRKMS